MKLIKACLLRDILDGAVNEARLSNPGVVALNRLCRAGLVTGDSQPALSDEAATGLLPDSGGMRDPR
jgi:hypothetical protein